MSREILDCLKRERDICDKNVIHSQNTAFTFTPALTSSSGLGVHLIDTPSWDSKQIAVVLDYLVLQYFPRK